MQPIIDRNINKTAHLMTDGHRSYLRIGSDFAAHSYVVHSKNEFSRGSVYNNTAESFSSMFERGRVGVFHFMSDKHLSRYLDEFTFRWEHREPVKKRDSYGKPKTVMKPAPMLGMLKDLIRRFSSGRLKRTPQWGIFDIWYDQPLSGR